MLGVLGFLPFILFALPAGVWVDRLRRRPILIAGDAGRAVLLDSAKASHYGVRSLIHAIVQSELFRNK